ncbi:hypothetical protein BaRGS_00028512 [Batillaria attramentaria]|uniref:Uncharacterized protein n=1 Tax=Batillaria attramentaria TaxID=370345 RepID=A0ABD0JZN7_9CAEN
MFYNPITNHIANLSGRIQQLEQALAQKDATIHTLQQQLHALRRPPTSSRSSQTNANILNSTIITTKIPRKDRTELNKNQRSNRNVDNKAAFTQLASILEGGGSEE